MKANFSATFFLTITTLVLLSGCDALTESNDEAPSRQLRWDYAPEMQMARSYFTATVFEEGRALVVGGLGQEGALLRETELYDALRDTWSEGPPLNEGRMLHTATRLLDSRILVVGGIAEGTLESPVRLAGSVLYDPETNAWSETGAMQEVRYYHSATRMRDGSVLVAGGIDEAGRSLQSAERLDPNTLQWQLVDSLTYARFQHAAVLLPDGQVFLTGGKNENEAVIYGDRFDSVSNTWTQSRRMPTARIGLTADIIYENRVLTAGGLINPDGDERIASVVEIYRSDDNQWFTLGNMPAGRIEHVSMKTAEDVVFIIGGLTGFGQVTSRVDFFSGTWNSFPALNQPRAAHAAMYMPAHGKLLVAGGRDQVDGGPISTVEFFSF